MIPASRSISPVREASRPLPWVAELTHLYEAGVSFRHGQLIMVAGHPASGKSLWVQWLCDRWNLPTLYVSMDMSQTDTVTRLGSLRTGKTNAAVKAAFEEDGPESAWIEEEIQTSLMDFVYDDAPKLEDFLLELSAYVEVYDHYPDVLVIDNLIDIDNEGDDEFRAWNQTLLWLKGLVRETGMTVIVIHHARELDKTDYPAPRKDFQGKPGKTPELMLSVSLTPRDQFRVAVVKNRTGKQDAMARAGVEFAAIPSKVQFRPNGTWIAPPKLGQGQSQGDSW